MFPLVPQSIGGALENTRGASDTHPARDRSERWAARAAKRVEVSVDGGQSWQEGRFVGPDLGRFAWRQFVLPVRLDAGDYLLASRAQDVRFNWQVEQTPENGGGFLQSGWRPHAIPLKVA